ncbi:MAG: DUF1870 family protein [Saccharospirillaceae bacterium]|nr:DUF1870 family protein [Saccharospirillaceae bacterium]
MNCYELQALRKLFMLDVKEAAELIGKVSARTWQYWESDRSPVPDDVAEEMLFWNGWRDDCFAARLEQCNPQNSGEDRIKLNYYKTLDDFEVVTGKRNVITWRLSQSVAAQLYSERLADLVESGGLSM